MGHVFHLIKLKFIVVHSCVLLSQEKISEKIKRKSQNFPKTAIAQKLRKKERGKRGTISI